MNNNKPKTWHEMKLSLQKAWFDGIGVSGVVFDKA